MAARRRPNGEGHKRSDGLYRVRLTLTRPDGTRTVKEFAAKTKKMALAKREAYLIAHGRTAPALTASVRELARMWLSSVEPTLKPKTLRSYRGAVREIEALFGTTMIGDIRLPELHEWLTRRAKESARSAGILKSVFSLIFQFGVLRGAVSSNPLAGVKFMFSKYSKSTIVRIKDEEELQRILGNIRDSEVRLFFEFLAESGLRPWKEAIHLTAEDLGFENGTYFVHVRESKTEAGADRYVPIPAHIGERLRQKDGLLFETKEGFKLNQSRASLRWRQACERAGLESTPQPYSLRRWAITQWAEREVPVDVAKSWAGHKDSKLVLDVYGFVSRKRQISKHVEQKSKGGVKGE